MMRFYPLSRRPVQGVLVLLVVVLLWGCRSENDLRYTTHWHELEQLKPPPDGIAVQVSGPRQGAVNDNVRYTVNSSERGYLWLIQVDTADQVTMLFPNELETAQRLSANRSRTIPGAGYEFTLSAPRGTQQLAFIVTSRRDDLASILPDTILRALLAGSDSIPEKRLNPERQRRWGLYRHYLEVQ